MSSRNQNQEDRELKKIVLVGPVYPYKGGISHYTGLMCKALRKEYDTTMISYKRQYPKFLFKKEQKDFENDSFKVENTKYMIHTYNPFNIMRSAMEIKRMNPDLVIIQWWHPYFTPCYWILSKLLGSIKTMFICHNVFPHERFPMDKILTRLILKTGDCFITHSTKDTQDLLSIKPDANYIQTLHPTYSAFKFEDMSMEKGRELLNLSADEHIILFFGFVREYKGLKHLLRAMPEVMEKDKKIKLLIVGDFGDDEKEYMEQIRQLNIESALKIYKGYIPDREVERYFAASDLVVLPYESATQSGIVQMAYGFEKPVLVTEVGGLPDVVTDQKTGYVVPPRDSKAIADKIIDFFRENKAEEFREHIQEEAYKFSWDRMRENITELYNRMK